MAQPTNEILNVYQAGPIWGLPSGSPFCSKLQFFLRTFDIPFEVGEFDPQKAPRGKMPYIKWEDGYLGDSQKIINALTQKHNLSIDSHLSEEQVQLSHVLRRMLEEGTYFNIYHERWKIDANWKVIKKKYFGAMPPVVRSLVPEMLRKQVKKTLHGHGISRYPEQERSDQRASDLEAVAYFMSNGPYFFGEQVSSLDWTVFAFVGSALKPVLPEPLKCHVKQRPKLEKYIQNVEKNYFPELLCSPS